MYINIILYWHITEPEIMVSFFSVADVKATFPKTVVGLLITAGEKSGLKSFCSSF